MKRFLRKPTLAARLLSAIDLRTDLLILAIVVALIALALYDGSAFGKEAPIDRRIRELNQHADRHGWIPESKDRD